MPRREWTQAEADIVLDLIRRNPDNITYAMKTAGVIINRTYKAIMIQYYAVTSSMLYRFKDNPPNRVLALQNSTVFMAHRNVKNNLSKVFIE